MKFSVLVAVFNEEKTIEVMIQKLLVLNFIDEIVIVDDGSTDGSWQIIDSHSEDKIIKHKLSCNQGKTAAINQALGLSSGDIIAIQDADLEYDPAELEDLLKPIVEDIADVVYGSRFMVKKLARVIYFHHYLANKFITFLSNVFTNMNMTDIETCYKVFRAPILKNIGLTSSGFGMEVEITAVVSKLSLRVYEAPISYFGRTYEDGKKIRKRDGVWAIWYIFYFNLYYPMTRKFINHKKFFKENL